MAAYRAIARFLLPPSGKADTTSASGRRGDRAAHALQRPGPDQPGGRGGQAGGQRRQREQGDAGEEDAAPAQDVARPAAEQEQAAEREGVGVEHPRQAGGREVKAPLDARQRDVDDGHVEDHHQLRAQDEGEGTHGAAAALPGRRGSQGYGRCR
jgi:hypothetical protein